MQVRNGTNTQIYRGMPPGCDAPIRLRPGEEIELADAARKTVEADPILEIVEDKPKKKGGSRNRRGSVENQK